MKRIFLLMSIIVLTSACRNGGFYHVKDGSFYKGAETVDYYIGTNMWYGALLGSETEAGNRERLLKELDTLKALGLTNLRVLVGGDGPDGIHRRICPTLQKAPGVYDENVFRGLDFLLAEMGKRDMAAVLYLNNAWDWSGGYNQYIDWADGLDGNLPDISRWQDLQEFSSRFISNGKAKEAFAAHVKTVVSRVNTITGKPYRDDPAIFSWQICNEPRCFSRSEDMKARFAEWICSVAALVKSLDGNHMVSVGSEGVIGSEMDMPLYEKIHGCTDIDYLTVHIWPFNWGWVGKENLTAGLDEAIEFTDRYIDSHVEVAERLGKPVVIEEFGYPRDGFLFAKGSPVTAKDAYYGHVFDRLIRAKKEGSMLKGVNFWAWSGFAGQSDADVYWHYGDDYCGDPAQEQQGLYSVYLGDSTVRTIETAMSRLAE